jgi:rare lipoprotein A
MTVKQQQLVAGAMTPFSGARLVGANFAPKDAHRKKVSAFRRLTMAVKVFSSHARPCSHELTFLLIMVAAALTLWMWNDPVPAASSPSVSETDTQNSPPGEMDFSARGRVGVASFYASSFFGRTMANGAPMDPHGNNAASRTLPLGTVANVTNVATGKSAVVQIEDRGPYVQGRIVDLSPATARKIGITTRAGLAKVVVAPIVVPLPGGGVKIATPAREHDLQLAAATPGA